MEAIKVGKKGTRLTLNGKPTFVRIATSFGWLGLLRQKEFKKAKAWLRRMKAAGFHGIRVFGEYKDWENNFFFKQVAALYDVWDWKAPRGSKVDITNQNAKVLNKAIEFLQAEGMIMEYVVDATVKSFHENLVDGYRDHMFRAVSQWFEEFYPDGKHNTFFELTNEYDVARHKKFTPDDISEIARRWLIARPEKDPPKPDHKNSLLGISEGGEGSGTWFLEYDPKNLTHVNVHSPRGKRWEEVGEDIKMWLAKYRKPICLNENMHYMTEEQWDEWIPKIPKWAGLSTKNAKGVLRQCINTEEAGGALYCMHFMTGMLTDPDLPMTKVEELFAEHYAGGNIPPDDPPDDIPDNPPPSGHSHIEMRESIRALRKRMNKLENKVKRMELDRETGGGVDPITEEGEADDFFRAWDMRRDNKFRRASNLHLRQATLENALMALQQMMLWDGVRNPTTALNHCGTSTTWDGLDAGEIQAIVEKNLAAIGLFESYIKLGTGHHPPNDDHDDGQAPDKGGRPHVYKGGSFVTPHDDYPGRVKATKSQWFKDLEEIILPAASKAADLNGIRSLTKTGCKQELDG